MHHNITFSVIIPVYNREAQIKHCVESVLAQQYDAFEVIVVDDGSTDNTAAVVQAIADPRLKYIHQQNKERGAARNTGWNQANGDYITFLDSDDEFLPEHLLRVAQHIKDGHYDDMICTSYFKEGPNGTERIHIPDDVRVALADGNFLSCNGVFIPKKVKDFRFSEIRELSGLEDWLLWLQLSAHMDVSTANTWSTKMKYHAGRSVLHTDPVSIEKRFEVFFSLVEKDRHEKEIFLDTYKRIRSSGESYMALHLAMAGYKKEARRHLKNALRLRPGWMFTRRYLAILKYLWT